MSAREMMTFIIYFPIMVGDFVSSSDDVWIFSLNFVEIIDILICFEISESNIILLENKIKTHNSQYVELFNDTLKPKFHNLTHYATILRQSGPLRCLWCFKFESKHRQFKIYSHYITTRKNICLRAFVHCRRLRHDTDKPLAKKYELKFAFQIVHCTHLMNKSNSTY
jgi:hypothetical protein